MPGLNLPVFTVSDLTKQIRGHLEQQFATLWVEGEISNLRRPSSGHHYFTLKDQQSQIRAVLFRSHVQRLTFRIEDGLEVLVKGRLSVYEPRGEYQLLLEAVEPKGIGELQLAFKQRQALFEAEGIFDSTRKRPLPSYPTRIGLVTSPFGAAIHDFVSILKSRWPLAQILIAPVAVQGQEAAPQISSAIKTLNDERGLEVIVVGRGGGSLEDLWAFNEELVVRAIAASRIPVVSAVGHETDVTLSDLAADWRAPTPSAAAKDVVPDGKGVQQHLEHCRIRLERTLRGMLATYLTKVYALNQRLPEPRLVLGQFVQKIDDFERRLIESLRKGLQGLQVSLRQYQTIVWENNPLVDIQRGHQHLYDLTNMLERNLSAHHLKKRHDLQLLASQLQQLSPLLVLGRGYSIVQRLQDGKILKKSSDIKTGESIKARLSEGEVICSVRQVK